MAILPIPIASCKHFAKCGERSLYWCRTFRDKEDKCKDCTLIKSHVRHNMKEVNGEVLRRCTICGEFLPLRLFYLRYAQRQTKKGLRTYVAYSSYCRLCIAKKYQQQKKIKL